MSSCGDWRSTCVEAVGPPTHYCAAATLLTEVWNVAICDLGRFESGGVGGMLCFGGLLHGQLVRQIQLGGVHRLGGLLGLTRQFIELCQGVVGGVGLHLVARIPAKASGRLSHLCGSLEDTCEPSACGRASRLRPYNCRDEPLRTALRSQTGYETASGLSNRRRKFNSSHANFFPRPRRACRHATPESSCRWMGTNRSRGARPTSASTSNARRSSSAKSREIRATR